MASQTMTSRIEALLFGFRAPVLLILLLLTVFMGYMATKTHVDAGFEKQLPLQHEYMGPYLEYLDQFGLTENLPSVANGGTLTYHGHCQQTAVKRDQHAVSVLESLGYEVDDLDSTCCGMAGSFGYEAEHYSMSMAVGQLLYDQVDDSPGEEVVAPGTSCRSQLIEHENQDGKPPHPIEKVTEALSTT